MVSYFCLLGRLVAYHLLSMAVQVCLLCLHAMTISILFEHACIFASTVIATVLMAAQYARWGCRQSSWADNTIHHNIILMYSVSLLS